MFTVIRISDFGSGREFFETKVKYTSVFYDLAIAHSTSKFMRGIYLVDADGKLIAAHITSLGKSFS